MKHYYTAGEKVVLVNTRRSGVLQLYYPGADAWLVKVNDKGLDIEMVLYEYQFQLQSKLEKILE